MQIEFDYDVSCGLDGYFINNPRMITVQEAVSIILDHCEKSNIDKTFALQHTRWKEFGSKVSYGLPLLTILEELDKLP